MEAIYERTLLLSDEKFYLSLDDIVCDLKGFSNKFFHKCFFGIHEFMGVLLKR